MIRVGSYYHLAAGEIEAITQDQTAGEYPHRLKITTRAGHKYSITYQNKTQRDREAARIAAEIDRETREQTITIDVVRYIVAAEIDKLRPYLRRIEKATRPGKEANDEHHHKRDPASEL